MNFLVAKNLLHCNMQINKPNTYVKHQDRKSQSKYYRKMNITLMIFVIASIITLLMYILLEDYLKEIKIKLSKSGMLRYNMEFYERSKKKMPKEKMQKHWKTYLIDMMNITEEQYNKEIASHKEKNTYTIEKLKEYINAHLTQYDSLVTIKNILYYIGLLQCIISLITFIVFHQNHIMDLYKEIIEDKSNYTAKIIYLNQHITTSLSFITTLLFSIISGLVFAYVTGYDQTIVFLCINFINIIVYIILAKVIIPSLYNSLYSLAGITVVKD